MLSVLTVSTFSKATVICPEQLQPFSRAQHTPARCRPCAPTAPSGRVSVSDCSWPRRTDSAAHPHHVQKPRGPPCAFPVATPYYAFSDLEEREASGAPSPWQFLNPKPPGPLGTSVLNPHIQSDGEGLDSFTFIQNDECFRSSDDGSTSEVPFCLFLSVVENLMNPGAFLYFLFTRQSYRVVERPWDL